MHSFMERQDEVELILRAVERPAQMTDTPGLTLLDQIVQQTVVKETGPETPRSLRAQ